MATKKLLTLVAVALCLTTASSDPTACKIEPMGSVLPKDDNCHQYILCLYKTAFTKFCPIGQGFSVAAKRCVDESISDCLMTTATPTPTSTLAPSVENGGTCINEERPANRKACEDQAFGALVSYPGNCAKFLVCDCENPTVKNCADGTLFDNKLKICNFPYNVKCVEEGEVSETTETTPKSTTTAASTEWGKNCQAPAEISADMCLRRHDGFLLHYPYDCHAYINCTRGCPVKSYCPTDIVFNPVSKLCDAFDEAQCIKVPLPSANFTTEKPLITVTERTAITTPENITTPELASTTAAPEHCQHPQGVGASSCSDQLTAEYQIYPYNCHAYIVCKGVKPCLKFCENNTVFDSVLGICDNDTKCQELPIPTHIATESTTVSAPVSGSGRPPPHVEPDLCQGKKDLSIYPYTEDCTKYLLCENNAVKLEMCPNGWLFNAKLMLCDKASTDVCYKEVVATTSVAPAISTTTPTATTADKSDYNPCNNQSFGTTFPHKEDCQLYYYCRENGLFNILSCPLNNYYDRFAARCGPNVSSKACLESATSTTQTPSPSLLTPNPTLKPSLGICGNLSNGQLVSYPENCRRYISCVRPVPIGLYCSLNWHFSEQRQKCIPDAEHVYTDSTSNHQTSGASCQGRKSGEMQVYKGHCKLYYECLEDGNFMLRACTQEAHFDPAKGQCSSNVSPEHCKKHFDNNPRSPSICKGHTIDKKINYPHNCTKYIQCKSPIAVAFTCNNNLQFSAAVQDCVESSQSACENDTKNATNKSSTLHPATQPLSQCDNKNDFTLMAHKDNCSAVILCLNNTDYLVYCKPGLYFDKAAGECLSGENKETCRVSALSENSPLITCHNKPNGMRFSHPTNCAKYTECQNHSKVQHECLKGLEFSAIQQQCLRAELAACRIAVNSSTSTVETSSVKSTSLHSSTATKTTTKNTSKGNATTNEATMKFTIKPPAPVATKDNICCGQKSGTYLPHPHNKAKFVRCQHPLEKLTLVLKALPTEKIFQVAINCYTGKANCP